jgi:hypothetical protein
MPAPFALSAMMNSGLIPGLGKGIAGGEEGIGSAFSGLGEGAGSLSSSGGIGGGEEKGSGNSVGGLVEKGLGAVGDFQFGDDEEDTNYDTMTIDNLEIDTLEIDTANIDKLVIDSKDLGKTDDNKTDNEKLDAKEQKETQDNLFSGMAEDSDTAPESLSAEGTSALPESLSAEGTSALPTDSTTTNIFNKETVKPAEANNNKEGQFLPNVETLTESSEGMTNMLGGGASSGGSFADLTVDASEMTGELGSISETLATPDEGPGFNWEELKKSLGGGEGGGFLSGVGDVLGGAWEGIKDIGSSIWGGITGLFGGGEEEGGQEEWDAMVNEASAVAEEDEGIISSAETLSSIDATTKSILASIESAYGMSEPISELTKEEEEIQTDTQADSTAAKSSGLLEVDNLMSDAASWFGIEPDTQESVEPISDAGGPINDLMDMVAGVFGMGGVSPPKKSPPGGQIHNTNGPGSRGMTPAYTKAPPPAPAATSRIIIEEVRSYNQYPPWMWKLG